MNIDENIKQTEKKLQELKNKRASRTKNQLKSLNQILESFVADYEALIQLRGKLYEKIHFLNLHRMKDNHLSQSTIDCYKHIEKLTSGDKDNQKSALLITANLIKKLDLNEH